MPLILRIHTYRKQAPEQPVERRFDQLGGTIGRAAGNDLELPDPGKYISRHHSKIDFVDGRYTLMDLGSNPSWINDRPVGAGKSAGLEHGDRLLIGDYVLEVEVDLPVAQALPVFQPESSGALPFQAQPPAAPSPYAGPSFDDLRDSLASAKILESTGGFDPFAAPSPDDPLGLNILHHGGDGYGRRSQDGAGGRAVGGDGGLGDIAGMLGGADVAPAGAPLFRGSEPDHVSPQFIPMPGARLPPAPAPVPVSAPVSASPMLIPDDYDPLADFLPPRLNALAAAAPSPMAAPWPQAAAAPQYQLAPSPSPSSPSSPSAPSAAPALSPAAAGNDQQVLQALLRGLGLPHVTPSKSPAETAELVGAMLREATAGTMAVLLARAMTKRESRLEMTVLGAQANNPLKFFPDAESALSQMLTNALAGYMPPLKSIGSAFDDLKAHELAVIAGMRAALSGVLARFDPNALEARMEPAGVMDKMMSTSRKAKMWDRMVGLYDDIQREADDDFQHLFGEKFSAAYEDQIGRLHRK